MIFFGKGVVIHLVTNNIKTDDSPKTIANKIAKLGKEIQRNTQAPRIIISGFISSFPRTTKGRQ